MGKRQHVKAKTLAALDQPAYLLGARAIYVVITALAVLWVYLTVLVGGGPPMQAAFAARPLGTSWEIGYHSRWVTCDCVLLQFAALTTLFNSLAVHRRNGEKWLVGRQSQRVLCRDQVPGKRLIPRFARGLCGAWSLAGG